MWHYLYIYIVFVWDRMQLFELKWNISNSLSQIMASKEASNLGGGWVEPTQLKKYARQNGNLPPK